MQSKFSSILWFIINIERILLGALFRWVAARIFLTERSISEHVIERVYEYKK